MIACPYLPSFLRRFSSLVDSIFLRLHPLDKLQQGEPVAGGACWLVSFFLKSCRWVQKKTFFFLLDIYSFFLNKETDAFFAQNKCYFFLENVNISSHVIDHHLHPSLLQGRLKCIFQLFDLVFIFIFMYLLLDLVWFIDHYGNRHICFPFICWYHLCSSLLAFD